MARFALLPCFALVVACGASAPRPEPIAAPRVTSAPTPAPETPAPTPETCEGIRECASVGLALARAREKHGAEIALAKACTGTVRSIDACAVLVTFLDDSTDLARRADIAHNGCNVYGADDGERAARGSACLAWGSALRDGRGAELDIDKALRAFDDGCKLGDDGACRARRDLDAELTRRRTAEAAAASGVDGANLQIGSLTTNGVTVENIACRSSGGALGGLFGSVALGKPFADKKKALDACVKRDAHKARVRWSTSNGRMSHVEVISGDDPSNRCIERALAGARTTAPGTCAASIDLGR
ncbi:MAG TPA: hypothetical protein VIF62_30830 [Labilithrix sp.]